MNGRRRLTGHDALVTPYTYLSDQTTEKLALAWGAPDPSHLCPTSRVGNYIDDVTGQLVPIPCNRRTCLPCNRKLADDVHQAIAYVRVDYFVTFTAVPECWNDISRSFGLLRRNLRRDGYDIEMVWAVELNPRGTGHHAHAFVRARNLSTMRLQARAHLAGMGRVDVQPVTRAGNLSYPMKLATWNQASLAAYRAANGAHILHATKQFWTDPITAEVLNRDEAIARARRGGTP